MGPNRGRRNGDARVRRLPAPDGPLLPAHPLARCPSVGGTAPLAGQHPLRCGGRRRVPVSGTQASGHRPIGCGAPLHALAIFPAVRRADFGHLAALVRPAVDAGLHGPVPSASWLAIPGSLCTRGGADQLDQRVQHHLRWLRPGALDPLRLARRARGGLASRSHHDLADRSADHRCLPLVGHRARNRGRLRCRCPQVHRDRGGDFRRLQLSRGPSGAGLLVFLRH